MNEAQLAWLALTCLLALNALFAVWSRNVTKWRLASVCAFVFTGLLSMGLLQVALGQPDPRGLPKGEFTVLGAKIEVDVAIYAMLDDGTGEPHLYRLPYSAGEADKLQQAIDATAGGQAGGVKARSDDQGTPEFYPEPVREGEPKSAERPMLQGS